MAESSFLGGIGDAISNIDLGSVVGAAVPALGTLLTAGTDIIDQEARSKAILDTMDRSVTNFIANEDIIRQQNGEVDRELGDAMTRRGLEAMKAEATLRAGAAETGTSGGTTEDVIKNVYMNQALDNAVLISRSRKEKVGLERRSDTNKLSLDNKLAELKGSLLTDVQAGIQTGSAAMSGFTTGYGMLPDYMRTDFFGGDE